MVLPTVRKPEGGFQFITVTHLCAVWTAYKHRQIGLIEVRVWWAAQEMVARRCQVGTGIQPRFRLEEWGSLLGRRGGILTALARLQQAGLLTWADSHLTFPSPHLETNPALATMLAQVTNPQRRIPVPRRLLRFLAQSRSRVLLATILGHLFRCLYYRQGQCRADGFCKASWIADVFGVSPRAVKAARQRLEALGFLRRTDTPQWVRNRYGQKMTINLQWCGTAPAVTLTAASRHTVAPPPAPQRAQVAPLDSDRKLLPETKYQKPAAGGSAGVLSTLVAQARECLRKGITLVDTSEPLQDAVVHRRPSSSPAPPRTPPLSPPCLQHIRLPDLQSTERLLLLYAQAMQRQLIGPFEADRLAFVALAHHVLGFRPANPGGLFLQLLRQRRFALITQAEEDTAQRRLSTYLYSPDAVKSPKPCNLD